jgi:pimeloyl-ACP methyl ester carboxylesterase
VFTPLHRGGDGPPLVLLHGFTDTWRTGELVLPALERRPEVIAPTLPGHAGGPPLDGAVGNGTYVDFVERLMDDAGWETAAFAGNSLGGYLALRVAERGRARSVVALAAAGGWAAGDDSYKDTLAHFTRTADALDNPALQIDAIAATREGRRQAMQFMTVDPQHMSADLVAHMMRGARQCAAVGPLVELALREGWTIAPEKITCPVRVVWGTADRLLPWPRAAARYRDNVLPHADWVELDDVGHGIQLDVPTEAAELILGFTAPPAHQTSGRRVGS